MRRYLPSGVIDLGSDKGRPWPGAGARAFWSHNHTGLDILGNALGTIDIDEDMDSLNGGSIGWDEESLLPSRVIDVGSEDSDPFLLVSEKGQRGVWIALSHCVTIQ
jgi:hypothetical protein